MSEENVEVLAVDPDDAENDITIPPEGQVLVDEKTEEDEEKEFDAILEGGAIEGSEEKVAAKEGEEAAEKPEGEEEVEGEAVEGETEGAKEEEAKEPSVVTVEEELSEESVEVIDRDALIARYNELLDLRTELNIRNTIYSRKAVDYYRRKKVPITLREDIPNYEEVENNYGRLLFEFEDAEKQLMDEKSKVDSEITKFKKKIDADEVKFFKEFYKFQCLEMEYGKKLVYSSNGKKIPTEVIRKFMARQKAKLLELIRMRFQYIMSRNTLAKMEKKLQQVDQLDEGFYVKDFEKLQAANDAFMKKLEEKDRTLLQQRAVCSTYVEKLAHMKEQMNCEVGKCSDAKRVLQRMEYNFAKARRNQQKAKHGLRKLKKTSDKQNDQMGLAVYPILYADFKETCKKIAKLQDDVAMLKNEMRQTQRHKKKGNTPKIFDEHCIKLNRL